MYVPKGQMHFDLRVLASGLIAWLHQDAGLPHTQISKKVEDHLWASIEAAWSSKDPQKLFHAVQLLLPLESTLDTDVMALLYRHVPDCKMLWRKQKCLNAQPCKPFGYQVSDDTNYLGVYPSKNLILWNSITEEEDARVLHILMVTEQYAKGYFRVLEWLIKRFRNTRNTIKSLLWTASHIVILHLEENRGTLMPMMDPSNPLNDLEALCSTYSAVEKEEEEGVCQAKKVSQYSRKELIQWRRNVQSVHLPNGLCLTIFTRFSEQFLITFACLSNDLPPSKRKIHQMYLEQLQATNTFRTNLFSALCPSIDLVSL